LNAEKIPLKAYRSCTCPYEPVARFRQQGVDGVSVWEPWGIKLMSAGGKPFGPFVGASDYLQPAIYWGAANGWRIIRKP